MLSPRLPEVWHPQTIDLPCPIRCCIFTVKLYNIIVNVFILGFWLSTWSRSRCDENHDDNEDDALGNDRIRNATATVVRYSNRL